MVRGGIVDADTANGHPIAIHNQYRLHEAVEDEGGALSFAALGATGSPFVHFRFTQSAWS